MDCSESDVGYPYYAVLDSLDFQLSVLVRYFTLFFILKSPRWWAQPAPYGIYANMEKRSTKCC